MSFAIVSLIILVVIAIILIPILMRVFGEAASRNPNRSGDERQDETDRSSGSDRQ